MTDTKSVEQAFITFFSTLFKSTQQILRRFPPHPFKSFELRFLQEIKVANILHHLEFDKLIDQCFSKCLDVHGIPRGEVQDSSPDLGRALFLIGTVVTDLTLWLCKRCTALGTT